MPRLKCRARRPGTDETTDAILRHFGSLVHRASGWEASGFLDVDVTMAQAKCLSVVAARPGIPLSVVAEQLHVGLSAVSGMVDRLVDHGYLERHEDPLDRRQQLVSVTASGGAVLERIRELNAELLRELLRGMSSAELEALRTGIAALDREAMHASSSSSSPPAARASTRHERTPA